MRYVAAAGLASLLLAGCSDGASQTLTSGSDGDVTDECPAGWTAYPGPPECSDGSVSASASPPSTEASPKPSYSASAGQPSSTTARRTPTRAPTPIRTAEPSASASATAGRASASPASTVRPATSPTPSPRPTGQLVITEADSGETFTITMSTADALLRLGDGWIWSQPEREGSSVELYQRQFVRDPGYAEWEIRPVSSGRTVIRSTGSLACHQAEPPCAAPNRLFEVTIVVS